MCKIKQSFTPDKIEYWRETIEKMEIGSHDIAEALVEAFNLGCSMTREVIEMEKANENSPSN